MQLISLFLGTTSRVYKSRDVGRALGQYLDGLRPDALIFVAHSLGCRVALEAIRFMVSRKTARRAALTGASLMAAAVPTYMIERLVIRTGASAARRGHGHRPFVCAVFDERLRAP